MARIHDAAATGDIDKLEKQLSGGFLRRAAEIDDRDGEGRTPLHVAAVAAQAEMARFLIEAGAEVNCQDGNGLTPLNAVVAGLNQEIVALLLEHGAGPNLPDALGNAPIHTLMRSAAGDILPVCTMLINAGADLDATDARGDTPLHIAIDTGRFEVARLLIDAGADLQLSNADGNLPLHRLLARGEPQETADVLAHLLDRGADLNTPDGYGVVPLHAIIGRDDAIEQTALVRQLLQHGADANLPDNSGHLPLQSVMRDHGSAALGLIEALLAGGADINAQEQDGTTTLHLAARMGLADVAAVLLEQGAECNATDQAGSTALHEAIAAEAGAEFVRLLLQHGADPNAVDGAGVTPLGQAVSRDSGWGEIPALLLAAGADPNRPDQAGVPPLATAAERGNTAVMHALLRHGADVNAGGALLLCAAGGRNDCVRLLLHYRVDISVTDAQHRSPLQLATENGHVRLAGLIGQHALDPSRSIDPPPDPAPGKPVIDAIANGDAAALEAALRSGADPNLHPEGAPSALEAAVRLCRSDLVTILLEHGAAPPNRLHDGTAWATAMGGAQYAEIARMLAERGVDVTGWDSDLSSPRPHPTAGADKGQPWGV